VIVARTHADERGRVKLFLGLSETNMLRLQGGQPIVKPLDEQGFTGIDVVVMGPSDLRQFCDVMGLPLPPDMEAL
jgi:hypothetical protein